MRVCVVNLDYIPVRTSGLAVYGERLIDGYVQLGCDVTVVTLKRGDLPNTEQAGSVTVHRVPGQRFDWIGLGWYGARLIQRLHTGQPFDAVHFLDVHFAFAYRGRYVASVFQSFRQRATAFQGLPYHTTFANLIFRLAYYNIARYTLERSAVRRATRLIAPSQSTAGEFQRHYGVPAEKITVVPLGIDAQHFSRQDGQRLRERLGLTDRFIILHVGFASPRKGLDTLREAMRLLPPNAVFVQVGKWDAAYRRQFQGALSGEAGRFIEAGYVSDTELPAYYSLADVAVFPSWLEGFGIPPAEAMACQTPVIAAAAGSLPEVVGDAGILFPPGDSRSLAAAILRCMNDGEYRLTLGRLGMERVRTQFDARRMAERTLAILAADAASRPAG